ncbi:MAG: hypothetical protein AB1690_09510 [Candidatus Zixiibacteriota bacterium]
MGIWTFYDHYHHHCYVGNANHLANDMCNNSLGVCVGTPLHLTPTAAKLTDISSAAIKID